MPDWSALDKGIGLSSFGAVPQPGSPDSPRSVTEQITNHDLLLPRLSTESAEEASRLTAAQCALELQSRFPKKKVSFVTEDANPKFGYRPDDLPIAKPIDAPVAASEGCTVSQLESTDGAISLSSDMEAYTFALDRYREVVRWRDGRDGDTFWIGLSAQQADKLRAAVRGARERKEAEEKQEAAQRKAAADKAVIKAAEDAEWRKAEAMTESQRAAAAKAAAVKAAAEKAAPEKAAAEKEKERAAAANVNSAAKAEAEARAAETKAARAERDAVSPINPNRGNRRRAHENARKRCARMMAREMDKAIVEYRKK